LQPPDADAVLSLIEAEDPALTRPVERKVSDPQQAPSGQRGRLVTFGDRGDDVWSQEADSKQLPQVPLAVVQSARELRVIARNRVTRPLAQTTASSLVLAYPYAAKA